MRSIPVPSMAFAVCLAAASSFAQAPTFDWAQQAGGANFDFGSALATDSLGNIYVAGEFTGTMSVDVGGSGPTVLTSVGERDVFVGKLSPFGLWQWVTQIEGEGGRFDDLVDGIAVDGAGAVYLTGSFSGSADFGTQSLQSAGSQDAFIAKLNTNGVWQWAARAGSVFTDAGYGIDVDDFGGVYVTGQYMGTPEFPADFGDTLLQGLGIGDIFVAKLNQTGSWLWAEGAGGFDPGVFGDTNQFDAGFDVAVDAVGDVYITGKFFGVADFGPNILVSNFDIAGDGSLLFTEDVFVAKLTSGGMWQWAAQGGGLSKDHGRAIAVDQFGEVYVTGFFQNTAAFISPIVATGIDDTFVGKLDVNGAWQWVVRAGGGAAGTLRDSGTDIVVDVLGDAYVTGYFGGVADFGATVVDSGNFLGAWAAKVDTNGAWQWARQMGSPFDDFAFGIGIGIDGAGVAFVTGAYNGAGIFGSNPLFSAGVTDAFVTRLSEPLFLIAANLRDGFFRLDLDANGFLDFAEAGLNASNFNVIETTNDGRLSLVELIAASVGPVGVAPEVFAVFGYTGWEMGTDEEPFDTLLEAALYVAPGGDVLLSAGDAPGPITIDSPMRLLRDGDAGVVRIGGN